MAANSVVQALKVLQDAGREDLIKEGVLEQAWVGLKRPKRSSAERVTAAVLACTSPKTPKKFKKFKVKSVAGRKVSVSPERSEGMEQGLLSLPDMRGGGARLTWRTGSSLRQRVAAMGRGSSINMVPGAGRGKAASVVISRSQGAMSAVPSRGQMVACAAAARAYKHAPALQKAAKQAPLAVESGGERGEEQFEKRRLGGAAKMAAPSGRAVFGSLEPNNPNLGHGLALEGQRFGRPADFLVPVEVRAPPAHQVEERAQSGAVRPTARETPVHDFESFDPLLRDTRVIPASRSANTGLVPDKEELDYEDEAPVLDVRRVSAPKTVSSGQAVQGDHLSSRREVVGGLRRGEVSGETGLLINGESNLGHNAKNVDVAIQVETREGLNESKPEGSLNATQVVTGKSVEGQVSTGESVTVGQAGSKVAEIPWAGTGSRCAEDGGSQGVMRIRRLRMLELVQQSIAPSTRRSYEQAWLEFLQSGAVKRERGFEVCEMRREDAIHFIMQQIELGLAAATISGELFRQDGVHLTFMGNELYLLDLRIMIADLLGEKLWDR
ncbi:hypothetical protein NDU88_004256 [Pleurodeles waltl]|uniref:Uncharacterized protein n=1 Tax=Pleurodeles waltl TaxID=8319 RepID=A0AAV7T7W3_PLEWA|nr:hypothetical protein NDU88_004256 [Pleurodeles waltl]